MLSNVVLTRFDCNRNRKHKTTTNTPYPSSIQPTRQQQTPPILHPSNPQDNNKHPLSSIHPTHKTTTNTPYPPSIQPTRQQQTPPILHPSNPQDVTYDCSILVVCPIILSTFSATSLGVENRLSTVSTTTCLVCEAYTLHIAETNSQNKVVKQ